MCYKRCKQSLPLFLLGSLVLVVIVGTQVNFAGASYALKDAHIENGKYTTKDLGTNWVILQKSMSWGDGASECEHQFFRLVMIPTFEKAKELVEEIEKISEPYTEAYDKKYKEVEFGMDRRYWIGLTDQLQENKWVWAKNGSEIKYDFWYPNQPDHGKGHVDAGKEHCATLWNPGYHEKNKHSFNDEKCTRLYYPICDKAGPKPPDAAGAPPPTE